MDLAPLVPKNRRIPCDSIRVNSFPVRKSNGRLFTGIFTGLSVEIRNPLEIHNIHENGCFGIGSKSKTTPEFLHTEKGIKAVTAKQLERKRCWAERFGSESKPKEGKRYLKDRFEIVMEDPFQIEEILMLSFEETIFLNHTLNCLKVMNFAQDTEFTTEQLLSKFCDQKPNFLTSFVAYHYLRSKHWVVKSGLTFGGDFLLYYKGPQYYHASFIVLVRDNRDSSMTDIVRVDMQGFNRVAESTNKEILVLEIRYPPELMSCTPLEVITNLQRITVTEMSPKRFNYSQKIL